MSDDPKGWKDHLLARYDFSYSEGMRVSLQGEIYRYERIDRVGNLIAFSQWINLKQAVLVEHVFFDNSMVGNVIIQPQLVWTEVQRGG